MGILGGLSNEGLLGLVGVVFYTTFLKRKLRIKTITLRYENLSEMGGFFISNIYIKIM